MELTLESLSRDAEAWRKAGVALPSYGVEAMRAATAAAPRWAHFGAGNIFRGFIASLAQRLLNAGLLDTGIVACETFDFEIIDRIYRPCGNLALDVRLNPDGTTSREIVASVAEAHKADFAGDPAAAARLREVFRAKSLQLVSFTITEKGYALRGTDGALLPSVRDDMERGPAAPRHAMAVVASLLHERFAAGRLPLAAVSMDNCSRNGARLKAAVLEIAQAWAERGLVEKDFQEYVADESSVSFPWTMIDKITPRPHPAVREQLERDGIGGMETVVTSKATYIAPFVNAEKPQYLVVEDRFPAGRPPLEKAGVFMTSRETVEKTERMKVTACLNPLHTAMSMYGCLLGYTLICKEMEDPDIVALVKRIGYCEGLPVAPDPGILSPKAFLDEVVQERLPNPFMPDDPRRIATDTSQKVGIRFGGTIKSFIAQGRDLSELVAIPLAIAGWLRYLLGVDDAGRPMEVSADPLKDELQARLAGVVWNNPETGRGRLAEILSNETIFGLNLQATPLGARIEEYFLKLLGGPGSARRLLKEALAS